MVILGWIPLHVTIFLIPLKLLFWETSDGLKLQVPSPPPMLVTYEHSKDTSGVSPSYLSLSQFLEYLVRVYGCLSVLYNTYIGSARRTQTLRTLLV